MAGLPVPHPFRELAEVHVHCIGDAIQPSHPLMSSSPSVLDLSQQQNFSNESSICIRWPKYWNFSFSISPSNKYSGLISLKIDWFDLLSKGLSGVFFWMLWWCKCYTHSVEVILWIFIFPGLGICSILLSHDTGQCQKSEPQLPVSHWIMRVNNQYTYNHAVSIQTSCFSLLVQHSTNYLKYSTLLKNRLVLDDFVQL